MRPTASYAQSYDNNTNKRQRLDLDASSAAEPPPFPAEHIGRVDKDENGVLLPNMMDLLASLPGATRKNAAINGRDTVACNGVMFVDTHSYRYLGGNAPDVTVVLDGYSVSDLFTLALLELQVRG